MPYKDKEKGREHSRKYAEEHKESCNENSYRWKRNHKKQWSQIVMSYQKWWSPAKRVLLKTGKFVTIENKPPKPNSCSFCGRVGRLEYHHWTDEHPEWGIWMCCNCHHQCEALERPSLILWYLKTKKEVEEKKEVTNGRDD